MYMYVCAWSMAVMLWQLLRVTAGFGLARVGGGGWGSKTISGGPHAINIDTLTLGYSRVLVEYLLCAYCSNASTLCWSLIMSMCVPTMMITDPGARS